MTSEICMMNRLAAVLAADSATTVTQVTAHGSQERYFKGANKIFQLSLFEPVGMMIYDSASILNVPWELVVKDFRNYLADKTFNELTGYASEFFEFLNGNTKLFPEIVQREKYIEVAGVAAFQILDQPRGKKSEERRRQVALVALKKRETELAALPFPNGISSEMVDELHATLQEAVVEKIDEYRNLFDFVDLSDDDKARLARVAVTIVAKEPKDFFGATGLVFAGYGDHDVFPSMVSFESAGIVGGKHVAREMTKMAISHDRQAWVTGFAQTDMTDTFTMGLSREVFLSLMHAVDEELPKLVKAVLEVKGITSASETELAGIIKASREAISDCVLDEARTDNVLPIRRVLGALPIEEMAELAETLINLQSLKEKMTKPSETVGGPIDVAVITRNEGLVWLKRKHFFDPALNSRYAQRQQYLYK